MRNYKLLIFLLLSVLLSSVQAQENFKIPLNIQKAFDKGTRSTDGKPGVNYWQNSANYDINIEANPILGKFYGEETIEYFNNSPDTLYEVVIRLYQDLIKTSNTRNWEIPKEYLTDGVNISFISVNGKQIDLKNRKEFYRQGANAFLNLSNHIYPSSSAKIVIKWDFVIPENLSVRMGHYYENTYHIAYWYPQISVYDDIDGWDKINYSGTVEFYGDFNNYDVKVKVPNNFAVWATGLLQNPGEVLSNNILEKFNKAKISEEVVNIITKEDYESGKVFRDEGKYNFWHFKAENVQDFAFSTSDRFLWDGVNYKTPDDRDVFISAAYRESAKDFYQVAKLSKDVIKRLSERFPGIPYPYPAMTAFNGGGGMEFPMMVNDASEEKWSSTVHLTSHEITHTYFPFYMGTNEKKYAFMDEGWAVMIPFGMQMELAPGYDPRIRPANQISLYAGTEYDVPVITPSNIVTYYSTYRNNAYNKPGMAYYYLREALGKSVFDMALKMYIKIWNGKHPIPYDFFNIFNKETGMNLNWYWQNWFFEVHYADLAIEKVSVNNDIAEIEIKNKGGLFLPVHLVLKYEDGSFEEKTIPVTGWENSKDKITTNIVLDGKLKSVSLGASWIPESVPGDNEYTVK